MKRGFSCIFIHTQSVNVQFVRPFCWVLWRCSRVSLCCVTATKQSWLFSSRARLLLLRNLIGLCWWALCPFFPCVSIFVKKKIAFCYCLQNFCSSLWLTFLYNLITMVERGSAVLGVDSHLWRPLLSVFRCVCGLEAECQWSDCQAALWGGRAEDRGYQHNLHWHTLPRVLPR